MKALLFGASGGLAASLADALLRRDWTVDAVTRLGPAPKGTTAHTVDRRYSEFKPAGPHDLYLFPQALFIRKPLEEMTDDEIDASFDVGLGDLSKTLRNMLRMPAPAGQRQDFCLVGSTSSYAGFKATSVYCAVKHGLVGLVRSLNDEYASTNRRFWLFSMGTMDTEMGRMLTDQDPTSFLDPDDVAERIVEAVTSPSNLFEPEVVIRRRNIRFKEA